MGPPNSDPAGTGLFRQGDRVRALYLIEAGLVKLIRSERAGRDVLVGLRTSGWLLGTAAGILGVVHPVRSEFANFGKSPLPTLCFWRAKPQ